MSAAPRSLGDYVALLDVMAADEVLIGGQAIAVWVEYFSPPEFVGPTGIPVTTGDADVAGTMGTVAKLRRVPGIVLTERDSIDDSVNLAEVRLASDAHANILTGAHGVDARKMRDRAVPIDVATGHTVYVMHPLDCMIGKVANLNLESRAAWRTHEINQTRAAIACVRILLCQLFAEIESTRHAKKFCKEVRDHARGRLARQAFRDHGVDTLDCFDPSNWKHAGGFATFPTQTREWIARCR